MMRQAVMIALSLVLWAPLALAAPGPDERMDDPAMEARAGDLYTQLRCVVCQSENIGDSNAVLAGDMRAVVRERILLGESDGEVLGYMRDRYGDYVLMRPPVQANTIALWGMPFAFLLIGGLIAFLYVRRQSTGREEALSAEEEAELKRLADEEGL